LVALAIGRGLALIPDRDMRIDAMFDQPAEHLTRAIPQAAETDFGSSFRDAALASCKFSRIAAIWECGPPA
jgi:hypothetical protein